jgi:hypothetical protein
MTERERPGGGLAALLTGLIDYAGLFPPAGLGMADAAGRYGRYRRSPDAWALGRFVLPLARLDELERAVPSENGSAADRDPWELTVLVSAADSAAPHAHSAHPTAFAPDVSQIAPFNESHATDDARWPAKIRSVELKAASPAEIERAAASLPPGIEAYFEVAGDAGIEQMCGAAAAAGHALKIRTGGTTTGAFPPSAVIARVLAACAAARVPFKATAGLHHPVRALHPVTYEPSAPKATMHGFVNVFVAACLLFARKADAALATQVLEDELASSFRFDEEGVRYRDVWLSVAEITEARRFARSFGSCSFEEPLQGLGNHVKGLGNHFRTPV